MTLKHYFPLSVLIFAAVVSLVEYFDVPVLPFALILLTGETLIGFQLEDHRVSRFLGQVFRGPKSHAH
ncbi:MAG: hypothetical protein LAO79_28150 [Acidobacteriia bacterium]|nr:hypothetical protein [Terriglobia bacterium]